MALKNEYGNALFLLSEEMGTTDTTLNDVLILDEVFSKNPEYVKLLDTPALPKAEKLALIDEAFGTVSENARNLVKILCEKHAVNSFHEIRKAFSSLYDAARGIEHVEAVTSVPMTEEQLKKMSDRLSAKTGKTVIIKNTVEPEILGGVKLRYSGIQVDGSVKTRLDSFEKILKNTVI